MVIVDSTKLDVVDEVALPGPADLIAYHSETNRVFVCNDDKPEMWVIDPMEKKIVSTINFPGGGMEDLGFDSQDTFLFQCLKDSSELAKLDLKTDKVVAKWSTSPVDKPHGMAMVPGTDQAAIVESMGKPESSISAPAKLREPLTFRPRSMRSHTTRRCIAFTVQAAWAPSPLWASTTKDSRRCLR